MTNQFLDAAGLGKNDWWRYGLTVFIVLFAAFVLGGVPLGLGLAYVMLDGDAATTFDLTTGALIGINPLVSFVLQLISFVPWLVALLGSVAIIHRRHPRTLVRPGPRIYWERAALAAGVWAILLGMVSVIESFIFPGRYAFTPNLPVLIPFTLIALVLIPIQISSEELLFRSYLLQGVGLLTRQPVVLSVLSGLLFALPHAANPEVSVSFWPVMGFYFIFGAALAAFTLREGGAELALGVHAANNLFTVIVANFEGSALQTPSLFTASGFDPWYNLAATAVALLIFYGVIRFLVPAPR
jgi:membrane protease YdiL (CAAX protease family)